MFRNAAADALSPHAETGRLQFAPHDPNHVALDQTGAFLDLLEGSPIFPGKPHDCGNLR